MILSFALILTILLRPAISPPPPPRANNGLPLLPILPLNLTGADNAPFVPQASVCYDERYASRTKAPSYPGCVHVIENNIATGNRPDQWHAFSRRPDPTRHSRVPKTWVDNGRSCEVHIDVPYAVAEMASLTEIQAAARAISIKCVLGNEHLGGFTFVGMNNELLVSIHGEE